MRVVDLARSVDPGMTTEFYDQVLRPSFTPDELPDDAEWLWGAVRAGAGGILAEVVVADDGTVVAGAVAEPFPDAGVLLLGYLATRPGWRSRGLGAQVLRDVVWPWTATTGCHLTIGEVADPRVHRDDPGAVARVRFYGRHGAKAAAVPFFQPRLSPDHARVHGELMAVVASRGRLAERDVAADTVRAFVEQYVAEAEGPFALDDPQVRWYLDGIGTGRVPLVPIDEYEQLPLGVPPES